MDKHKAIANAFEFLDDLKELIDDERMEMADDYGSYYESMGKIDGYEKCENVIRDLLALVMAK